MSRRVPDRSALLRFGRAVARIARWEASRSAATLDRTTVAVGVAALLLAGGVVGAGAATGGVAVDRGIYRVGVAPDSPYREPVAATPALVARPPDRAALASGDLELLVTGGEVVVADSPKGRAALATFRDAVRAHNTRLLREEPNRSAAFPVVVDLRYLPRGGSPTVGGGATGGATGTGTGPGGTGDGGASGGATGETSGADGADGGVAAPDMGSGGGLFGGTGRGSPAEITPPFPFGSLVLAFAFLVPMNFVVQAYGSSMLEERINRRGELLLVTPVAPAAIVAGKTLPYLGAMVALVVGVALLVGGGAVSVAAVVPIALTFLGATFAAAMFARSFKELTFVTVSVSVFLTSYAFVPAIFTNVTPVALISPLSLVVRDLQGEAVALGEYLFATGPMYLVGASLFALAVGVYREEDLFTQRAVPLKLLDALAARIRGLRSAATLAALSIPFVLLGELLALALLFALPRALALPLLFVAVAVVEEVAKSLHVYAGMHEGGFARTPRAALLLGGLAGLGFFVGEKLFVVVQVVGLTDLPIGAATAATAGVLPVGALVVAPLVLHAATASVSALAATRGRNSYLVGLGGATLLHAGYNLAVVSQLG
ncbi:MAG: PrsW family intramembrane metalloprotease [Haloferacaceae archaeon]